jgi:O-antigen/teichoic acid export membrane protein
MIAASVVRCPAAYYANVLFAYERHVFPNVVMSASAILRMLMGIVALVWLNVGIVGFFVIQLIGGAIEIVCLAGGVWLMQPCRWVRPRWHVLRDIGTTIGGLTLVSLTAVILSQIDKVILSKLLNLSDFGLYTAGYTLAMGLVALAYPVGNAVFPSLSRMMDTQDQKVQSVIRSATELTVLLLVPVGAVLMMQSEPLLKLLFLIKSLPDALPVILPLLVLGGLAQGFVTLPHLFQTAAGRISIVVWINTGLVIPYAFGFFMLAGAFNVYGAALAFAVSNVARLLAHWAILLMNDNTRPLWRPSISITLATLTGGLAGAALAPAFGLQGNVQIAGALTSIVLIGVVMALALPYTRRRLVSFARAPFNSWAR